MKTKIRPNKKLINVIITLAIVFLSGGFIASTIEDNILSIESNSSNTIVQGENTNEENGDTKWKELVNVIKPESIETQVPVVENSVSGELQVHFIDVGQADSTVIINNGEAMVIDAGNNADSDLVVNYIKRNNIADIKYLVGTHPHEDHIGGLDKVIDNFNIGTLFMPKIVANTKTYNDVVASAQGKELSFTAPVPGDIFKVGEATCTILGPNSEKYSDTNDYSISIKLEYGDVSFIFTGDAEKNPEKEMLEKRFDISATVLKLGHHGSDSSSSDEFMTAVNPKYAIVSAGFKNDYGHPRQSVLDKLKKESVPVYRTDEQGTIIATTDGSEVKFNVPHGSYNGFATGKKDE